MSRDLPRERPCEGRKSQRHPAPQRFAKNERPEIPHPPAKLAQRAFRKMVQYQTPRANFPIRMPHSLKKIPAHPVHAPVEIWRPLCEIQPHHPRLGNALQNLSANRPSPAPISTIAPSDAGRDWIFRKIHRVFPMNASTASKSLRLRRARGSPAGRESRISGTTTRFSARIRKSYSLAAGNAIPLPRAPGSSCRTGRNTVDGSLVGFPRKESRAVSSAVER
jgi:hypothetical protein